MEFNGLSIIKIRSLTSVDESLHGIDIISSWGITSHENGGSDGEDMFSRLLDVAMEEGVTVIAAGNDGPDRLSGMGSSSLSITVVLLMIKIRLTGKMIQLLDSSRVKR